MSKKAAQKKVETTVEIDARGIYYRDLNEQIYSAVKNGCTHIILKNVNGQRYIGGSITAPVTVDVYGTAGQDLASFMKGPLLTVYGNAQDGVSNTMDEGKVIIHGMAGDVLGYGMRGGRVYVGGDVGYRVGIHMKEYLDKVPIIVVGGKAGDFLGEYMAGGIIIVLGVMGEKDERPLTGNYLGTGMHGGAIYVRGKVKDYQLGKGLSPNPLNDKDKKLIKECVKDFCKYMNLDSKEVLKEEFIKVMPYTHRPYGNMYAY